MSDTVNSDVVIQVKDLTRWYIQKKVTKQDGKVSKKQTIKAVDGVSFELKRGETLGVIGESGCGKSTLGRVLIHLEDPTAGEILYHGVSSTQLKKKDRLAFCRMKLHKIGANDEERHNIMIKTLEDAGMAPATDYIYRHPHELSGGQLQRISILRSMLLRPTFLVADEPVSMLDVSIRADIINMLQTLSKEENTAMVFISHDIATTRYISDRVAVMYLGRIVETGVTDEVLHNPQHTKVLISNCASLDPLEKREIIEIEGEPPTPINTGPGCYFAPRCYQACEKCFKEYPEARDLGNGHIVSCHFVGNDAEK